MEQGTAWLRFSSSPPVRPRLILVAIAVSVRHSFGWCRLCSRMIRLGARCSIVCPAERECPLIHRERCWSARLQRQRVPARWSIAEGSLCTAREDSDAHAGTRESDALTCNPRSRKGNGADGTLGYLFERRKLVPLRRRRASGHHLSRSRLNTTEKPTSSGNSSRDRPSECKHPSQRRLHVLDATLLRVRPLPHDKVLRHP